MKIPIVGLRHEYDTNVQVAQIREEVFLEQAGNRGGWGFPQEPHPSQFYVVADVKYDKSQGYQYMLINKATKKIQQTNVIYRESDVARTNGYKLGFCKVDSEYIDLMPEQEFKILSARANALAAMNVPEPQLGSYRELPKGYKGTRYIPHSRKFTTTDLLQKINTYCKKQYPDYDIHVEMDGSEYVGKMKITINSGPQELRSPESVLRGYVRTRGVVPNDHYKTLLTPQGHNMLIDITQYAMSYNARHEHEDYPDYYLDVNVGSWETEYITNPNIKEMRPSFSKYLNDLSAEQVTELHEQMLSQITDLDMGRSEWEMYFWKDPMNTMDLDLAEWQYDKKMEAYSVELKSLEDKLESVERQMQRLQYSSIIETFNTCCRESERLSGECDRLLVLRDEAVSTQNESRIKELERQLDMMTDPLLNNRAEYLQARRTLLEEAIRQEIYYLSDNNAAPNKDLLDKWADRLNIENRMPFKSCRPTIEQIGIGRALANATNNFSQIDCLRILTHEPANSSTLQNARRQVLAEAIREEIRFQQADYYRQRQDFASANPFMGNVIDNEDTQAWDAFQEKYDQEYEKWNEVLSEIEKQIKDSTISKVKNAPSQLLQSIERKINESKDTNTKKTTDIQNIKTI